MSKNAGGAADEAAAANTFYPKSVLKYQRGSFGFKRVCRINDKSVSEPDIRVRLNAFKWTSDKVTYKET